MFSSPGANSLHDALDDDAAADLTGQMQVEQEERATTSELQPRVEDGDQEALAADAAPAPAAAAAIAWCDDDRIVLAALRKGCTKHKLSLARLRTAAARRGGLTIENKKDTTKLKKALEAAEPTAAEWRQMQVEQEERATTSEGRLRAEDAEARDEDGDLGIEEAPAADAAPAPAPAAASVWTMTDRNLLVKLEAKQKVGLEALKGHASRHNLPVPTKQRSGNPSSKDYVRTLKAHLRALKPKERSDDSEDGIVVGARVLTPTHGAGVVLEDCAGNGQIRVQLDVPFLSRGEVYKSEVAIPKAQLTRLAPGDAGYEAPSMTGAAGSGAAAVHAQRVAKVLANPGQHPLGFDAPEEVVARRAPPKLVLQRPLLTLGQPDKALDQAANDAFDALQRHKSKVVALQDALKQIEAKLLPRSEEATKAALVKAARDAVETELAAGQKLKDAFAEASRARNDAMLRLCPALAVLVTDAVDPLREEEAERAALQRRVDTQLLHSDSDAVKKLGNLRHPVNGAVLWDVAPHRGTPPRGVLALQCPRGNCRARYWFPFKEVHDDVMRDSQKNFDCKMCGFRMYLTRGDFGDRRARSTACRAREGAMDDELVRWGVDFE